jgi:hypothetical protein
MNMGEKSRLVAEQGAAPAPSPAERWKPTRTQSVGLFSVCAGLMSMQPLLQNLSKDSEVRSAPSKIRAQLVHAAAAQRPPASLPAPCAAHLPSLLSTRQGHFEYSTYSAVVVIESVKMIVASTLLAAQLVRRPQDRATFLSDRPLREFASFSVPAAIYACTNNLGFLALLALHPTTTTIIGQSKIIFTGLLFRQMLKRRLSAWQALILPLPRAPPPPPPPPPPPTPPPPPPPPPTPTPTPHCPAVARADDPDVRPGASRHWGGRRRHRRGGRHGSGRRHRRGCRRR